VSILLTGAAGTLPRALDATLRERGHHVLSGPHLW
jgi:nucleoside-diphosphate-sugar epimerase